MSSLRRNATISRDVPLTGQSCDGTRLQGCWKLSPQFSGVGSPVDDVSESLRTLQRRPSCAGICDVHRFKEAVAS